MSGFAIFAHKRLHDLPQHGTLCDNTVIAVIDQHLDLLRRACLRHSVARLEVFGSAAETARFDPDRSDIDFIVSFLPGTDLGPWLAEYFALRDELAELLGRQVELVMESALRNPFFQREANRTRQVVYANQDTEAA
jgi:hypothetical protein